MKRFKDVLQKFWNDEAGQGTAEYVLLLVLVVAIVMAFGTPLKTAIMAKVGSVTGQIQGYDGN